MIFKVMDRKGTLHVGGSLREWCCYDRLRKSKCRQYHVFSLCRIVRRDASYMKLVIGPWVWAWGYKDMKGVK